MRLICPKCSAQYEVDASVIPATGRDVQCSNCGRTWFQQPEGAGTGATEAAADATGDAARHGDDAGDDLAAAAAEQDEAGTEIEAAIGPEAEAGAGIDEPAATGLDQASQDGPPADVPDETWADEDFAADDNTVAEGEDSDTAGAEGEDSDTVGADVPEDAAVEQPESQPEPQPEPQPAPPPEPAAAPRRQTLDDAVLNVLREEAAREARARAAEGTAIETQSDLGLTAAIASTIAASRADDAAAAPSRDRVARLHDDAEDADEADDSLAGRGSRRELLPDIEEINSTLRATSDRGDEAAARDAPETLRRRRSGFRMGFSTSLIVAVFLLAIYVLAPVIAARAPSLEPSLARYVAAVDQARFWLDAKMKSSTEAMRGSPSQ